MARTLTKGSAVPMRGVVARVRSAEDSASTDTTPVSSAVRDMTSRLADIRRGLEMQGERAQNIANAFFGSIPEPESTDGPEHDGMCLADSLSIEIVRVEAAMHHISAQIDRLTGL